MRWGTKNICPNAILYQISPFVVNVGRVFTYGAAPDPWIIFGQYLYTWRESERKGTNRVFVPHHWLLSAPIKGSPRRRCAYKNWVLMATKKLQNKLINAHKCASMNTYARAYVQRTHIEIHAWGLVDFDTEPCLEFSRYIVIFVYRENYPLVQSASILCCMQLIIWSSSYTYSQTILAFFQGVFG